MYKQAWFYLKAYFVPLITVFCLIIFLFIARIKPKTSTAKGATTETTMSVVLQSQKCILIAFPPLPF